MLNELFSFKGRIGRLTYFWHSTGDMAILLLAILIAAILPDSEMFNETTFAISLIGVIFIIIAGQIIELAATVKRFHDLGKSGWHLLGGMIPFYNIILALMLLFQAGQPFDNKYGKYLNHN